MEVRYLRAYRNQSPRLDHLQELESMKVHVMGYDAADAVLTHEDRRVHVVHEVSSEVRQFADHFGGNIGMTAGLCQHIQSGRGEQRLNERPCLMRGPWLAQNTRMCRDTHEFIDDRPRRIPRVRAHPLTLQPTARREMERRVRVGSVDENVGVDDEQRQRPSIT